MEEAKDPEAEQEHEQSVGALQDKQHIQRRSIMNNATKILSIKSVINHQKQGAVHLRSGELNKLSKIKSQIQNAKEKALDHLQGQEETRKKNVNKLQLNVDTDSEDEDTGKATNLYSTISNNGYLDKKIRQGAELAKAKLNVSILFNEKSKMKKSSAPAANAPTTVASEKIASNSPTNNNARSSSINQSNSLNTNNFPYKQIANQQAVNKSPPPGSMSQSTSDDLIDDSNLCFLKSLTQNQNLPNNCDMSETIENDRINISIRTTDFFTFIRLEDEVDELRRKHNEFEAQKEAIKPQKPKEPVQPKPPVYDSTPMQRGSSQSKAQTPQSSTLPPTLNPTLKPSPYKKRKDEPVEEKSDGKFMSAIYYARKFAKKLKGLAQERIKVKRHLQASLKELKNSSFRIEQQESSDSSLNEGK